MRVTMQDIANYVGVSKMTISLYIKNHSTNRISNSVKAKIEAAIKELKYVVPRGSGIPDSDKVLGILFPFEFPLFKYELINGYLNGIQQELLAMGYSFIFIHVQTRDGMYYIDSEALQICKKCRGIIIFGTRHSNTAELQQMADVLNENNIATGILNFPVEINNVIQGFLVDDDNCNPFQYLISLGHKRILFIGGGLGAEHTKILVSLYKETLDKNGIGFDPDLIIDGGFESYTSYSSVLNVVKAKIDFSAAFCMSTQMVVGCYRALQENKISIPEDVSVVNYGDPYFTEFLNPSLTTVHMPLELLGQRVARKLISSVESGQRSFNEKIYLPNFLNVRHSTSIKK